MTSKIEQIEDSVILYDDQLVSQIGSGLFDFSSYKSSERVPGQSGRHAAVRFVQAEDQDWALRHYFRGGLAGKILNDQYLWAGEDKTRSFREWRLLADIQQEGLPGPVPVAARYRRRMLWYTADLITQRILNVLPFATHIKSGGPDEAAWFAVGACVGRFHVAGFYHADLNAHNLMMTANNDIWLLDWDRGDRRPDGKWRDVNLARLNRSCFKVAGEKHANQVSKNWPALLEGYRSIT